MHECTICNKEFKSERSLAGHRSSHSRDNDTYKIGRQKVFIDPNAEKPKKHCQYCNQEFDNGWQLGGHTSNCYLNPNIDTFRDNRSNNNTSKFFKRGIHKGYRCDSSWELAYLLYCLDYGIKIERNKQGFSYEHEGKTHRYYPDFVLDGTYVEIKGQVGDRDFSKWDQFPNKLEVIGADRIHTYVKHAQDKYGRDFIKLYD